MRKYLEELGLDEVVVYSQRFDSDCSLGFHGMDNLGRQSDFLLEPTSWICLYGESRYGYNVALILTEAWVGTEDLSRPFPIKVSDIEGDMIDELIKQKIDESATARWQPELQKLDESSMWDSEGEDRWAPFLEARGSLIPFFSGPQIPVPQAFPRFMTQVDEPPVQDLVITVGEGEKEVLEVGKGWFRRFVGKDFKDAPPMIAHLSDQLGWERLTFASSVTWLGPQQAHEHKGWAVEIEGLRKGRGNITHAVFAWGESSAPRDYAPMLAASEKELAKGASARITITISEVARWTGADFNLKVVFDGNQARIENIEGDESLVLRLSRRLDEEDLPNVSVTVPNTLLIRGLGHVLTGHATNRNHPHEAILRIDDEGRMLSISDADGQWISTIMGCR